MAQETVIDNFIIIIVFLGRVLYTSCEEALLHLRLINPRLMGPLVLFNAHQVIWDNQLHLMADRHICLAHVVRMSEICPFVPIGVKLYW